MNRIKLPAIKLQALWLLMLGFIALTFSCNKDFENVLPKTFPNDTAGRGAGKKVLLIILDGVKGNVVRQLAPTNITEINSRAAYSFDGLADDRRNAITNAAGWANIITGVDYRVHRVQSDDFANLNVGQSPTLFSRIKENVSNARTVSIASTAIFNEKLATDATIKINATDDAEVKNAALTELGNKNATVVVAQFHSAETAGAANGYTADIPAYANAIQNLDTYIGNMMDALKARPTYNTENWLVVIASNKGGAATSGGGPNSVVFEDLSRNTYMAFYNPRFNSTAFNQPDPNSYPFVGAAPRFTASATAGSNTVARLANSTIGNFGNTGSYVIQFKMRNDGSTNQYWPNFFSKNATHGTLSSTGWAFSFSGTSYQNDFGAVNGNRPDVSTIRDAKWHTIAAKISVINGTRTVTQYSDGVKRGAFTNGIAALNLTNAGPITIGTIPVAGTNFLIRDIAIYNLDMSDDDIIMNMKKEISLNIANQSNLVGWWPCNEGAGLTLFDRSGKGNNFTLTANASWATFNELSPNISGNITDGAYRSVFNGVDATLMIYHWLNISVPQSWGLMGSLLIPGVTLPTN